MAKVKIELDAEVAAKLKEALEGAEAVEEKPCEEKPAEEAKPEEKPVEEASPSSLL